MADEVHFNLDDSTITVFLNDPAGPVGDLMGELADDVATRARATAPVRSGALWNDSATPSSNARTPGFLKASIHGKRGVSRQGRLYGSANAEADPLVFIAYPAKQIPKAHRNLFMSRALYSVNV